MDKFRGCLVGLLISYMSLSFADQIQAVHLNQADVTQLSHAVKGIGLKRAEAIVHYREAHGPFQSLSELALVKGIGHRFVEQHQAELETAFVLK